MNSGILMQKSKITYTFAANFGINVNTDSNIYR
jgi:hypothetical protein